MGYFNGYDHGFVNGCGFGGGPIMMFLFFILAAGLIYFMFRNQGNQSETLNQSSAIAKSSDAIEIAKTRLAKGEITTEEFEKLKKNL